MYTLVILPAAAKMAREAYEWYEEQQVGLGDLFLREMERCLNKIEYKPALYAVIKKSYRQIIFKTFPYLMVFEIMDHSVVVYCVFHTSRNPRKKFIR